MIAVLHYPLASSFLKNKGKSTSWRTTLRNKVTKNSDSRKSRIMSTWHVNNNGWDENPGLRIHPSLSGMMLHKAIKESCRLSVNYCHSKVILTNSCSYDKARLGFWHSSSNAGSKWIRISYRDQERCVCLILPLEVVCNWLSAIVSLGHTFELRFLSCIAWVF